MAQLLSPEESARKIVAILRNHDPQAGIQFQALAEEFLYEDISTRRELMDGFRYAGENGWIKTGSNDFVLLTEIGVSKG